MNSTVFWTENALGLSSTADDPGRWVPSGLNLHMVAMLFLVSLMCWMAVLRGVETSGSLCLSLSLSLSYTHTHTYR